MLNDAKTTHVVQLKRDEYIMLLGGTKKILYGAFNSVALLDKVLFGTNCIQGFKVPTGLWLDLDHSPVNHHDDRQYDIGCEKSDIIETC